MRTCSETTEDVFDGIAWVRENLGSSKYPSFVVVSRRLPIGGTFEDRSLAAVESETRLAVPCHSNGQPGGSLEATHAQLWENHRKRCDGSTERGKWHLCSVPVVAWPFWKIGFIRVWLTRASIPPNSHQSCTIDPGWSPETTSCAWILKKPIFYSYRKDQRIPSCAFW